MSSACFIVYTRLQSTGEVLVFHMEKTAENRQSGSARESLVTYRQIVYNSDSRSLSGFICTQEECKITALGTGVFSKLALCEVDSAALHCGKPCREGYLMKKLCPKDDQYLSMFHPGVSQLLATPSCTQRHYEALARNVTARVS